VKTIVALPGQGIGIEVVDATCEIMLMLEHVGLAAEATRLEAALARVYRDGQALTPDQRGTASTKQMATAVLAAYRNDSAR
jgi:isocitrate/isopropylmalate dehydrogenase